MAEIKFNSTAGIEFLSEKSYSIGVIEIAVTALTLQGQGHFSLRHNGEGLYAL